MVQKVQKVSTSGQEMVQKVQKVTTSGQKVEQKGHDVAINSREWLKKSTGCDNKQSRNRYRKWQQVATKWFKK